MDCEQLIFKIIIGFIFIICSKFPLILCYNSAILTPYAMGVQNAELYIKVKGGHFEHIMKIKPIIIVNINCSQSIFSKNYQYHSKNLIHSVNDLLQKWHFQMGHPVYTAQLFVGSPNISQNILARLTPTQTPM